jgi:O-acetyl-ADP-ribose deacetylase (regulator of RNase III)
MQFSVVTGDILEQQVDVIVNSWNRNIFPWWLLLPQGVSGAIKKKGGLEPFRELSKKAIMPLGSAVFTKAGNLPFKAIIHVAGINLLWFGTEYSIRQSVKSALTLFNSNHWETIAFPLIGSGSGNRSKAWSKDLILDEIKKNKSPGKATVVEYL